MRRAGINPHAALMAETHATLMAPATTTGRVAGGKQQLYVGAVQEHESRIVRDIIAAVTLWQFATKLTPSHNSATIQPNGSESCK